MPLAVIQPGRTVRLVSVNASQELQRQLSAMGLIPGEEIDVVKSSFQGPFVVRAKGTRIMLCRAVVRGISVA